MRQLELNLNGPAQGATFEPDRDKERLSRQRVAVYNLMADGVPRTPKEMEAALPGYGWASIGARLRELRTERYGRHEVVRTSLGAGLFTYQLKVRA